MIQKAAAILHSTFRSRRHSQTQRSVSKQRAQFGERYRIAERQAAATCNTLICYEVSSCHIDHGVARSHSACVIKTVINQWWQGALAFSEILKTGNYRALFTCCCVQTWGPVYVLLCANIGPCLRAVVCKHGALFTCCCVQTWGAKREPIRDTHNYLFYVPYTITLCDWVSAWVTSERQRTGVTYIKVDEMENDRHYNLGGRVANTVRSFPGNGRSSFL